MSWSDEFEDQIAGLRTLRDAADHIQSLYPKAQQKLPHWQAAVEALIMAAENRGPLLHARADMLKAMTQKSRLAGLKKSGVVQGYGVVRGLHEQVIARTIRPEEAKPAILQTSLHSSSRHFTL
jgi:hypothetical protein